MAGKLNTMLYNALVDQNSAVFYFDRIQDDFGVFHVQRPNGGATAFAVSLQGRATSQAGWATIVTVTQATLRNEDGNTTGGAGIGQVVQLMPEMRVVLGGLAGTGLHVYIQE